MKRDPAVPTSPSWQALLVVCKDCQKRGSGPKRLRAKALVREARAAAKAARPRLRVVASGCLGLYPERAIAVARVDATNGVRLIAATAAADVAVLAAPALSTAAATPPSAFSRPVDRVPDSV